MVKNATPKARYSERTVSQPELRNSAQPTSMLYRGMSYAHASAQDTTPSVFSLIEPLPQPTPQKQRSPIVQKFLDLPLGWKQTLALVFCGLAPIVGLGAGSTFVLINSLRSQLVEQSKSEVAVTETNYNIKINQMGFGSRGQSDNAAIISAAKAEANREALSADLREQVRQILKNEVKARKMEYATLVGKDAQIIVNANADRQGETFNPDGLVGEAIKTAHQIKASTIVPWSEIQKENPSLPPNFSGQDALIRYVVTPVKNPDTKEIIGALVFGDIVNYKLPIVENTLKSFGGGYSAVYLRLPNGQFIPATTADKDILNNPGSPKGNQALPSTALLEAATTASKGEAVTGRIEVNGVPYTVSAKAVPNKVVETDNGAFPAYSSKPTAILVRGTDEDHLNMLLRNSLLQEGVALFLALFMILLWSSVFRKIVVRPVKDLEQTTQAFALGDREARAAVFSRDEVGQLATMFNYMADGIIASEGVLSSEVDRQLHQAQGVRLVNDIVAGFRRSLKVEEIVHGSMDKIRDFLHADRVVIYRFNEDLTEGSVITESVAPGFSSLLGQSIWQAMTREIIEQVRNNKAIFTTNPDESQPTSSYSANLSRLEVKADIVAPIKYNNQILGLLCAHQCSDPRQWQASEVDLMGLLATQIGYAFGQAHLLEQQEESAKRTRQLYEMTLRMQETLKQQSIFDTVVRDVRKALATDRAVIYLFDSNWKGTFVAESVDRAYSSALGSTIYDPCFAESYVEKYQKGRVQATPDVFNAGLTACHLEQLEPFEVKANLVAPILVNQQLLGLLIVHECSASRQWTATEIDFFRQTAIQLGLTLDRAALFEQREEARLKAETISQEQSQQKEALQRQLLTLLSDVEVAASGDLTVRADVTAGDIGTVADFFNSIVESLRQIVTRVKQSALHVNSALGENEGAIRDLAEEALSQAQKTALTLDSVEKMTDAMRIVADSASRAAEVSRIASKTATTSGNAMDLTVQNILGLRDTIGETAKKVKRLGESSQQISKVVSLINQIALQTNLLAINAGIEAARAGEEGQGFAVVAEEVGELAARSAAATHEIEQIVETIQRETSEVVAAMEQGTTQVVEGTYLVENAKQSLGQILEISHQIDALVQSISEATVSQVQTSQTITDLMEDVAKVAENTSKSSLYVSDSLHSAVEIAKELQESVEAFKVS